MKKFVGIFLGLFMTCSAVAGKPQFRLGGGLAVPTGDIHALYSIGLHGMGGLTLPLGSGVLTGFGDLSYHVIPGDDEIFAGDVDLKAFLVTAGLQARITPEDSRVKLYALGGVGLADLTVSFPNFFTGQDIEASKTDPMVTIGGGLEIGKLFGEFRWNIVLTEGESTTFVPMTAGIRF